MYNSSIKIYLEHRVFVRVNEDVNLILSSLQNQMVKYFPEIVSYDQERITLEIARDDIDSYKNKGYMVGHIDSRPTIVLSKKIYELPQDTYGQAIHSLTELEELNLLKNFAVVEITDSRHTDILGV